MSAKLSDSLVSPENSLNQTGVRANTNEGVKIFAVVGCSPVVASINNILPATPTTDL